MIRVQWRETGEYLIGYVEGPGFIWSHNKSSSMKFPTIEKFRAFEAAGPCPGRWCAKTQIRFRKVRT